MKFKIIFPWLLAVIFGAALFFVYNQNQDATTELSALRQQKVELEKLRGEVEELNQKQVGNKEVERLKKENAEVYRLRNEVSQLKKEQAKSAQAAAIESSKNQNSGIDIAHLSPEQIRLLAAENERLR